MSLTQDKFNQGMTSQEYLDQVKVNKQAIEQIYANVETPAEATSFFDGLNEPLQLAIFTAAWCGDAISTTPTIMRLAENTSNLKMAIFDRDQELDLTNSFLPEHRAGTVPVFIVFDSQMRMIGRFIETAKELVPTLDKMEDAVKRETLEAAEIDKPMSEISETSRTAFRGRRTAYRVDHAKEWGNIIANSFTSVVRNGLALPEEQRPAEGGTEWPPQ